MRVDVLAFRVAGMTCAHCKRAIEDELVGVASVTRVEVELGEKLVTVHGDGVDPRAVEAAIERAGYSAILVRRDSL